MEEITVVMLEELAEAAEALAAEVGEYRLYDRSWLHPDQKESVEIVL